MTRKHASCFGENVGKIIDQYHLISIYIIYRWFYWHEISANAKSLSLFSGIQREYNVALSASYRTPLNIRTGVATLLER